MVTVNGQRCCRIRRQPEETGVHRKMLRLVEDVRALPKLLHRGPERRPKRVHVDASAEQQRRDPDTETLACAGADQGPL